MDDINFIVILLGAVNLILVIAVIFLVNKLMKASSDNIKLRSYIEAKAEQEANLEKVKHDSIDTAKAAIFDISNKISENLLNLHKQEQKQFSEVNNKTISDLTKQLNEDVINISKSVSYLAEKVKDSGSEVNLIKRALLSPSYVGQVSETTLENILKSMGLIPNLDYFIQLTVGTDIKLRPDAVVMLPGNNVMIIDSKASKHFFEMFQENSTDKDSGKFLDSMNTHLKQLSAKDYKESVRKYLDKTMPNHKTEHMSLLMFLPSESMLEKLSELDKTFYTKAWEIDVFPVGPSGLVNILSHAKYVISESKKAEYAEHIIVEVNKIISSLSGLLEYSRKVGANIKTLAQNYDKMAASFNGNLLPKIKKVKNYGIGGTTPLSNIERYQIVDNSNNEIEIAALEEAE